MTIENDEKKINVIMHVVRLTVPIILAALGWYVGQTVGTLNNRLIILEHAKESIRLDFNTFKAEENINIRNILDEHKMINTKDNISRREFDNIEKRLEKIENKGIY